MSIQAFLDRRLGGTFADAAAAEKHAADQAKRTGRPVVLGLNDGRSVVHRVVHPDGRTEPHDPDPAGTAMRERMRALARAAMGSYGYPTRPPAPPPAPPPAEEPPPAEPPPPSPEAEVIAATGRLADVTGKIAGTLQRLSDFATAYEAGKRSGQ